MRTATERDKNRLAAQKAYAEAEVLKSQRTAESNREAIKKYEEALPLYRAVGDKKGEASTVHDIGEIYDNLGEKQKAHEYYKQALSIRRELGYKRGEAHLLNDIGWIYSALNENRKALEYFNLALPINRAGGDKDGEGLTLTNIGEIYNNLGEKQKTLEYYKQALPLFRAASNQGGLDGLELDKYQLSFMSKKRKSPARSQTWRIFGGIPKESFGLNEFSRRQENEL